VPDSPRRKIFLFWLLVCIVAGIASRLLRSGNVLLDKYFGDAAYAVMIYLVVSQVRVRETAGRKAVLSGVIVIAIETFQLTGLPLGWRQSDNPLLKALAIVLGTEFSWLDMAAYAIGIAAVAFFERWYFTPRRPQP
jgi:hypothetical protein